MAGWPQHWERLTLYEAVAAVLGRAPTAMEWTRFMELRAYGEMVQERDDFEPLLKRFRALVEARYPDPAPQT